jgi:hypothetical protein
MRKSIPLPMPRKSFIKKLQTIVLLLLMSLGGCKKDSSESVENKVREEFTIVEFVSNTPVQGATVIAAANFTATDSAITNDSGKVVFNTAVGVNHLWIHKDKYWPGEFAYFFGWPTLTLTPIATLKVHLTRVNQYPPGYILNMWVPGGDGGAENHIKQLTQPRDGIIYIKGRGNCRNSIGWSVDDPTHSTDHTDEVLINRFDTAEFEIKY